MSTYPQLLLAIAALLGAGLLTYRFRLYLRARNNKESIPAFIDRARADRQAYVEARATLHGSRGATMLMRLFSMGMLIFSMWLASRSSALFWVSLAYVGIGMYVAPRFIKKPLVFMQVTSMDRAMWHLDHSWLWPLLVARNSARNSK
jgi:hypothetical protein